MQRGTTEGLVELLAPGVTTGRANGVPEKLWLDPDGVAGACSVDGPGGSTVVIVWVGTADGEIVMTVVEGFDGVGEAEAVTVTVMGFSFAVLVTVTMEGVAVAVVLSCESCGAFDACDWACVTADWAVSGEPCDGGSDAAGCGAEVSDCWVSSFMYFGTAMLVIELPAPSLSPFSGAARADTFVFDWLGACRSMSMHVVYVSSLPLGRPGSTFGAVGHSHTQYRVYGLPVGASEGIAMSFWHQRSAPIS